MATSHGAPSGRAAVRGLHHLVGGERVPHAGRRGRAGRDRPGERAVREVLVDVEGPLDVDAIGRERGTARAAVSTTSAVHRPP